MNTGSADYQTSIAALLRELGIPEDYADNRSFIIQPEAAAEELTTVAANSNGNPVQLIPPAAIAWDMLKTTVRSIGITLVPLSGFRSVNRQAQIIRRKLSQGSTIPEILANVAAPGYSEHHTGRALDLGAPDEPDLEESFAMTPAHQWLLSNAAKWGFHLSYPHDNPQGIVFEPWHWCWRPE